MSRALAKIIKLEKQKLEFRAHQGREESPPDKWPRFPGETLDSIIGVRRNSSRSHKTASIAVQHSIPAFQLPMR